MTTTTRPAAEGADAETLGLTHVASCSFLASRLAPSGAFFAALGGGVAVARIAAERGPRVGYGASLAAVVQTVALIGPARVSGPLTQALNAPIMGHLQARGASRAARVAAGLAIRYAHYVLVNVAFVLLVIGGLDEFVATYDRIAGFLRILPQGQAWAIGFTFALSIVYGLAFTIIQMLTYERALARWPAQPPQPGLRPPAGLLPARVSGRTWLALGLTAAAWIALLARLRWPVLGAVTAGLAVAVLATRAWRGGRDTWTIGLTLAVVLSVGALGPAVIGAVDWSGALQRAVRAALLVLTATWARQAIGTDGLREVARRILGWLGPLPAAREAAELTARLESDARLAPAGKDLLERLNVVELKPAPLADALTDWIVDESRTYRPPDDPGTAWAAPSPDDVGAPRAYPPPDGVAP